MDATLETTEMIYYLYTFIINRYSMICDKLQHNSNILYRIGWTALTLGRIFLKNDSDYLLHHLIKHKLQPQELHI